jgi:hypothetical protein
VLPTEAGRNTDLKARKVQLKSPTQSPIKQVSTQISDIIPSNALSFRKRNTESLFIGTKSSLLSKSIMSVEVFTNEENRLFEA